MAGLADRFTRERALFAAPFVVGGVLLDFLLNGVCKVGTIWIWGAAYFGVACVIGTWLLESKWERWTRVGVIGFLVGSLGAHLVLAGAHSSWTYSMSVGQSADPSQVTLRSDDWPQTLIVKSEKVRRAIEGVKGQVPVKVLVTRDYGCILAFIVDQVNGIDVRIDPDASWAWKRDKNVTASSQGGPGTEDQVLPWCPKKP